MFFSYVPRAVPPSPLSGWRTSHHLEKESCAHEQSLPKPRQELTDFLSLWMCLRWKFPRKDNSRSCVTGSFHAAQCLQGSSMWLVALSLRIFIPFCGWITFHCMDRPQFVYLFISWWPLGLFPFGALMNMLWTFMDRFLRGHTFSFLLVTQLEMGWLGLSSALSACSQNTVASN